MIRIKPNIMKATLFLAFAFAASNISFSDIAHGQDKPKDSAGVFLPAVQFVVSTSKTNYAAGERIELTVVVTNGSARTFAFNSPMPVAGYKFRLIGQTDKQEAPLTRIGRKMLLEVPWVSPTSTINVSPGTICTNADKIAVNQLFDVTVPQEYELTISKGSVHSNPVRFSVRLW